MKHMLVLTTMMAMFAGQVQAQCQQEPCCDEPALAYCESEQASYMSALIPLGAVAIAAILIATTDRHHHHSSSNGSHSHSHSHSH